MNTFDNGTRESSYTHVWRLDRVHTKSKGVYAKNICVYTTRKYKRVINETYCTCKRVARRPWTRDKVALNAWQGSLERMARESWTHGKVVLNAWESTVNAFTSRLHHVYCSCKRKCNIPCIWSVLYWAGQGQTGTYMYGNNRNSLRNS